VHHRTDHSIQARTVPASGQHTNAHRKTSQSEISSIKKIILQALCPASEPRHTALGGVGGNFDDCSYGIVSTSQKEVVVVKSTYALVAVLLLSPLPLASAQQAPPATAQPALTQQAPARQPVYQTNPPIPPLPTKAQHEANFDAETQQANALFVAGKQLDALPFYADLCRQDPTVALFAERHAAGLLAKYSNPGSDSKESLSFFLQALNEIHRAQSLGDNSNQIRVMLTVAEKTPMGAIITGIPLTVGYTYMGTVAAQATMKQAEAAFGAQRYDEAAKFYVAAAGQDPAFYTAALFAGDAFFRFKDYANAGLWFQKAIAIDPDRETAYRYWGDSTYRSGDIAGAGKLFIQAYVAEPYSTASWGELAQWAAANKTPLTVPQIRRPEFYMLNGKVDFDPHILPESGDGRASWLVYQHVRVSHGATTLVQNMPPGGGTMANGDFAPNGYLHTLVEELDALTALLADVKAKLAAGTVTQEKLDPGLKLLLNLQKDNMLECFVLLNAYDMGLRHDYAKYRATHRDQLVAYIEHYLIAHSATAATTQHPN
jgi:tetratricopeptide (TPR) repeat protein